MKRFMVVVMIAVMVVIAITGLLMVPAFSADKLIVKDANSNTLFTVQDACVGANPPCATTQILPLVGIGTAAPLFPVSVVGSGNTILSLATTSTTGGAGFQLSVPTGGIWYFKGTEDNGFKIRDAANSKDVIYFQTSTGNVGIGTDNPSHRLQLAGGAYSDGMTWNTASSREYKDNIKDLSAAEAVATVKELNPVTYTYKVDAGEQHIGFIAEDVPALVAAKDRKGLSAMDIVAVLTKVVQEQNKTIEALSTKIDMLEKISREHKGL
jgi:hypothetical protein